MPSLPSRNKGSTSDAKVRLSVTALVQSHMLKHSFFISLMVILVQKNSNMQKYLVLVKLNPMKTMDFFNSFNNMSSKPMDGVNLNGSYNVFGNWDIAIWFEADSNENAVHFVGDKIRAIEGVVDTHTMPATTIKEYL